MKKTAKRLIGASKIVTFLVGLERRDELTSISAYKLERFLVMEEDFCVILMQYRYLPRTDCGKAIMFQN